MFISYFFFKFHSGFMVSLMLAQKCHMFMLLSAFLQTETICRRDMMKMMIGKLTFNFILSYPLQLPFFLFPFSTFISTSQKFPSLVPLSRLIYLTNIY